MKIKSFGAILLAVSMIFVLAACGGKSNSTTAASTLSPEEQQAVADKLAEEAQKVPEPETVQTSPSEVSASANTSTSADEKAPSLSSVDKLLGEWSDVTNPDRFAKITKDGNAYKYEDNDGAYRGEFKDGVLIIQISGDASDTAKVFIDASTGNLVTNYQGDIYEFSRKLK